MALSRKFVDAEGVHWQVCELSEDSSASELQLGGWLYFFSRDSTRSLAAYPADWSMMDWPGLERLCRHAAAGAAGWCTRAGSWTPDRGGTGRRALTERRWSSLLSRDSLCGCKRVSAIFVAVV